MTDCTVALRGEIQQHDEKRMKDFFFFLNINITENRSTNVFFFFAIICKFS